MGTVMLYAALSCVAFFAFFALFITGLLRRMNNLNAAAVLALIVAVGTGAGAVIEARALDIQAAPTVAARRSGMDIYREMFGLPAQNCVSVTKHHDLLVPGIDKGICVRARICADELRRILQQQPYSSQTAPSSSVQRPAGGTYNSGDLSPEMLGDTVFLYRTGITPDKRSRWLYSSVDSSEVVVVDVIE